MDAISVIVEMLKQKKYITPLEKDFNKVDAALIKTLFDELCLDAETVNQVVESLK